jgi:magnesium-transporting ATPase (P-type)
MSGGVQRVLHDKTVSNTIKRDFHFHQYAVYTVAKHPSDSNQIIVYYRGAPEIVLESCTIMHQDPKIAAEQGLKKLSADDKRIIFDRVNLWRILDMSVEAFAYCFIHISDAPMLFERLSAHKKSIRSGKIQTILCDYDKETIASCSQCKHKTSQAPCEFCDLARVLFQDLKESTMLGIVSFANRPAPSVAPVLKALGKSGIRFSWFGSSCEPAVLDFGKSLGLETDWNCCLSLQDLPEGVSSRLPAGISAIKKHVEGNDDVPLRVPMFCDATPSSVQAMIQMYQDNGEVVAVVGSSLKVENMEAFLAADLAFSLRPRVALRPSKVSEFHQQNNVLLAGKLISAPCTLTFASNSEYFSSALIHKILVARLLYINTQQAVFFTAHSAMLLILSQFLCCVARMPSLISAGHMGFITFFLIPALSASCLLSPDHESFPVVKRIPDKRNDDDQGTLLRKRHLSYYSAALILPSALLVFLIQLVSLIDLGSAGTSDVFAPARPVFPPALIEQAQVPNPALILASL